MRSDKLLWLALIKFECRSCKICAAELLLSRCTDAIPTFSDPRDVFGRLDAEE